MNENNEIKVLVCIPSYNVEKTIGAIVKACKKYATEVVIYDDGSKDNTGEAARIAGAVVLRSSKNTGYGFAIKSLFSIR